MGTLAVAAVLCVVPGPAAAAPGDDFYVPPSPLPTATNGDLIRTAEVTLLGGSPLAAALPPVTATRILYRSTDTHNTPIAVSGIVLNPTSPWHGLGPRPLVSYAVGTHGGGDSCAASKLIADAVTYDGSGSPMFEFSIADLTALLAAGFAVVVTDYEGIGTPGGHTYLQPVSEGHAVLDAARAAIRLGAATPDAPVAVWGSSQGGGAALGAAQLAASYAPDLQVKGTVAVATPVDPAAAMTEADGSFATGLIGLFVNGIIASHPELTTLVTEMLNPAGQQFLHATADQCVTGSLPTWAMRSTSDFTTTGQTIIEALRSDPRTRAVLDGFVIGGMPPADPMLIAQSDDDDLVPAGPTRELAASWCAQGADLTYLSASMGHAATLIVGNDAIDYLSALFAGSPARSTC
ncbi:alpha/beta fold hydrolase [Nocardia alba]|uniref:alpha/beta fold hydrolase n=1 Tax=Nocardia alba TaxID=225051 RepID=UPI001404C428|nr:lipase family protein [Nocardia alba]